MQMYPIRNIRLIKTASNKEEIGPSVLCAPAEQTKVATIFITKLKHASLFFLLFLPPLFKTTEGVVVLFQIFAWAPN